MNDRDITEAQQSIELTLSRLLTPRVVTDSVRGQLRKIALKAISEATEFAEPAATVFRGKSKAGVGL